MCDRLLEKEGVVDELAVDYFAQYSSCKIGHLLRAKYPQQCYLLEAAGEMDQGPVMHCECQR